MQNTKFILSIIGILLFFSSCINESLISESDTAAGFTRLFLSISDAEEVVTRSTATYNEYKILDAHVLAFSIDDGQYLNGGKVNIDKIANSGTSSPSFVIPFNLDFHAATIVVLLNTGLSDFPEELRPGFTGYTKEELINHFFPATAWDKDRIEKGEAIPMCGEEISSGGDLYGCRMKRAVAKIELNVGSGLFEKTVWSIYNVLDMKNSAIYPTERTHPASSFISSDKSTYTDGSSYYIPEYPSATMAKGHKIKGDTPDKTFDPDRPCLILETDKGFYRIDLYDHNKSKFIDIDRNSYIRVRINKVNSDGYSSIEEALATPGSNLEYDIYISSTDDHLVFSNGQYGISLSNDVVYIFGGGPGRYNICTAKYILPAGMTSLPSNITNTIEGAPTYGDVRLVTDFLPSVVDEPIEMYFADSLESGQYQNFSLSVKLGNITKSIIVYRYPALDAHYSSLLLHEGISVLDAGNAMWIDNYVISSEPRIRLKMMEENIRPVSWIEVIDDDGKVRGQSYIPIFKPKYYERYVLIRHHADNKSGRAKFMMHQEAPRYAGWWGGEPNGLTATDKNPYPPYYSRRMIIEGIEEPFRIWDQSPLTITDDKDHGLENTIKQMKGEGSKNCNAYNCYMKNDRNANGVIDYDEPVRWYLPAANQLMGICVGYQNTLGWNQSLNYEGYSSSTVDNLSGFWGLRVKFYGDYLYNFFDPSQWSAVRCVRDMEL